MEKHTTIPLVSTQAFINMPEFSRSQIAEFLLLLWPLIIYLSPELGNTSFAVKIAFVGRGEGGGIDRGIC